ncbi:MAG: hypothetical protein IT237_12900 [Bacteroidia bacterium]|jgi:sporulation protein YlmC with PRC-barrel domain|nr:hypothetical protein [Bacteroidia bacterium]
MNYNEFKTILKKSSTRILIIGIFILLIGLPIICANFFDSNKASYWILGGIFTAIGLLMTIKPLKDISSINTDTHPLLSAILKGNKEFVIWIYQKEIISKVEGANVGKSNNVVIWTKTNKQIEIVLSNKTSPLELIKYLSSMFPNASVGYSKETENEIKQKLK